MISLRHLPLKSLSVKHHDCISLWAKNKRFDPIFKLYNEFYSLRAETVFPKVKLEKFKVAMGAKKKEILLDNLSKVHPRKKLVEDFFKIFKLIDVNWSVLMKGEPAELRDLIKIFEPLFSPHRYRDSKGKVKYTDEFQILLHYIYHVFDYDTKFLKKETDGKAWDGYQLATKLGVDVCPYCNRQYASTVIHSDTRKSSITFEKIIRPEFDHFYAQSLYPYLALSFYNLVPSCKTCNSYLKRDTEMDIDKYIHPYMGGFENILKFKTGITVDDYLKKNDLDISIKLLAVNSKIYPQKSRAILSSELFKVEKIYAIHSEIAREIFKKSTNYTMKYLDDMYAETHNGVKIFDSPADLYVHYLGSNMIVTDFYKRPLSKFQRDISEETELLKYFKRLT